MTHPFKARGGSPCGAQILNWLCTRPLGLPGGERICSCGFVSKSLQPPKWIKPQLTRLVDEAPTGKDWLHEIKYDGYRMHARLADGKAQLLTRTGLDWSHRYNRTIEALRSLKVRSAYLDGELCALSGDGLPVFSRLQAAMDAGRTDQLVFFAFDLLFLNGQSTAQLPLIARKERLKRLFKKAIQGLRYNEHVTGDGPRFREHACKLCLEGVISKRADRPYVPGDRGIWVKSKCLNREEFVVVGWTDPEGSRRHIGALLLGYYTEDGRLHYAGRAGTGINDRELNRLAGVLAPLQTPKMPLAAPPPRDNRFGSPLKLSRVHWVRPEVVVEVAYLTWTEGGLLRAVSYQGQREDKPAGQVVRSIPHRSS
jgi:DNA ligase D-like protein (predicted ligase)